MPLFITLTKERICQKIGAAKHHVVLAAPGVSVQTAKALQDAHERLGPGAVQVVLDVSPRVSRLGYGEFQAVEMLKGAGISVRHHVGLRVGALICDDAGWTFATSPSLVEADPAADTEAFNAIALTSAQVMILRAELPPANKSENLPVALDYPVVGSEPLDDARLTEVKTALDIAPPQQFDLARQTQIYAALIQFVELTFTGFKIESRRIQLPKTLPLIASKDKALKERLTSSLKVLDGVEKPKELQEITERLNELREAYLVPVGYAGRVILKSKRKQFDEELSKIEKRLNECREALKANLQKALDSVVGAIVPDLSRAVLEDPPPRFRGLFPLTPEAAADYVRDVLEKVFPTADNLVSNMKIQLYYKDVTYETLKNKDFLAKVMEQIPSSILNGSLLTEELAVKAGEATT